MPRLRSGTRYGIRKRESTNTKARSCPAARSRSQRRNHWPTEPNSPTGAPSGPIRWIVARQVARSATPNCGIRRYGVPSARR